MGSLYCCGFGTRRYRNVQNSKGENSNDDANDASAWHGQLVVLYFCEDLHFQLMTTFSLE